MGDACWAQLALKRPLGVMAAADAQQQGVMRKFSLGVGGGGCNRDMSRLVDRAGPACRRLDLKVVK